jgi:hypothetical protein
MVGTLQLSKPKTNTIQDRGRFRRKAGEWGTRAVLSTTQPKSNLRKPQTHHARPENGGA